MRCPHRVGAVVLAAVLGAGPAEAQPSGRSGEAPDPWRFRTFLVTRSMASERLFPYLEAAKPELVQIGQYGPMFHGYADDEKSKGTPMQLPFSGERRVLDFQRDLNRRLHERGHLVVGHFRFIKVMGNWEERSGFVDWYDDRWPEDLLGPKPHPNLAELLARDARGTPIPLSRYGMGQLGFCLSSPHTRQLMKQMLELAVDHGIDGVMTTYNYRYDCVCPYCQDEFKEWIRENLGEKEIREKLGIEDLAAHRFESIPAKITGYPIDPEATTELDWLAIRWGAEHFKQAYDEIFVGHGRSLKKDLIVARWDHLSQVSLREERNFVPLGSWGKGEDYFWYSGGASFAPKKLNLAEGIAGDAWLSSLYIRELGGGKPFVIGKYDGLRMEASMAEGYATGGLGMGRYMRFEDPHAFEKLSQYTNFMHQHRGLYDGAVPFADAALVLPRQSVWNRRPDALDEFRALGQALVERQFQFDVLVDERITPERLARYSAVILPNTVSLSDSQIAALEKFRPAGRVFGRGNETGALDETGKRRETTLPWQVVSGSAEEAADFIVEKERSKGAVKIESPWTVRVSAYLQADRLIFHFVNYNRDESKPADRTRKGAMLERPIPVGGIDLDTRLPGERKPTKATLYAPERENPVAIPFEESTGRLNCRLPEIRVYGVVVIDLD